MLAIAQELGEFRLSAVLLVFAEKSDGWGVLKPDATGPATGRGTFEAQGGSSSVKGHISDESWDGGKFFSDKLETGVLVREFINEYGFFVCKLLFFV